ncbi:hypothetical protein D3C87_2069780 [compost metagenome]
MMKIWTKSGVPRKTKTYACASQRSGATAENRATAMPTARTAPNAIELAASNSVSGTAETRLTKVS